MKQLKTILLAVSVLLAAVSCNRYETVKNDPLGTKIYTLDNGMKIYMSVNKEEPRIQTFIAVKVGGKNDPSETTGLAHYFEHLMFKGSESFGTRDYEAEKPMLDEIEQLFETYRKTTDPATRETLYHRIDSISYEASKIAIPNEYDKLMAMIGAEGTNAWTSHDETVYVEDIPSNQIDNWARIQADRFRHNVIRGFHTELETIYEEKNMSLTQDNRKLWEALDNALFPHHPYGQQTVLGTQEHLKNPSITNVRKYHDTYYVPNNIAVCVSGDFNPDEMVAAIEKYFGDWEPNPEIPVLQFEAEEPITSPVVREVYGLEAEMLALGWRLNAAKDLRNNAIANIAGSILSNGQAGLMDLDIMQQQKALYAAAGVQIQPDYSTFLGMGTPVEGQTLEQLRDLILTEVAKLRAGEFEDSMIDATVNHIKLEKMEQLESNRSRANLYVDAFINGIDWADAAREIELYETITKEDVVAWANEFLGENSYVVVYKRQGVDNSVQKISAPKITPIVTNRDQQSAFLQEIQASSVKPIEPVFTDFSKDMSRFELAKGAEVLYRHNSLNDIFSLSFVFNVGTENDPELAQAFTYLPYLGTEEMSAEQIATRMYELACNFSVRASSNQSTVTVSGLSENMEEAVTIVEKLIAGAVADENILTNVKANTLKARMDAKMSQRSCFGSMTSYVMYGPEYISNITLSNGQLAALDSESLLGKVRDLWSKGHEILYYGPLSEKKLKTALAACHKVSEDAESIEESFPAKVSTEGDNVLLVQYDAKQLYYLQVSNRGESFDPESEAVLSLYNEYFGGGMNSIVFQEMREARGLAYSAYAVLSDPSFKADSYVFRAFIATQNDKLRQAVEAFDDIINQMPESEAAFAIAKEAMISRMRTQRTTKDNVLWSYLKCRRLGLDEPMEKAIFEKLPELTLADVKDAQEKWIKDRSYTYAILGDIKDLDVDFLRTLGPVREASLEEVFGY